MSCINQTNAVVHTTPDLAAFSSDGTRFATGSGNPYTGEVRARARVFYILFFSFLFSFGGGRAAAPRDACRLQKKWTRKETTTTTHNYNNHHHHHHHYLMVMVAAMLPCFLRTVRVCLVAMARWPGDRPLLLLFLRRRCNCWCSTLLPGKRSSTPSCRGSSKPWASRRTPRSFRFGDCPTSRRRCHHESRQRCSTSSKTKTTRHCDERKQRPSARARERERERRPSFAVVS